MTEKQKKTAEQKALKQRYAKLRAAGIKTGCGWEEYFAEITGTVVELASGDLVGLKKPRVEKDFCFSYNEFYNGSYEDACDSVRTAYTSESAFIDRNMEDIDRWLKDLRDPFKNLYRRNQAEGVCEVTGWYHDDDSSCRLLTDDDRARLIAGYEEVKEAFLKRLRAYLKRYGLTKVHAWSYSMND